MAFGIEITKLRYVARAVAPRSVIRAYGPPLVTAHVERVLRVAWHWPSASTRYLYFTRDRRATRVQPVWADVGHREIDTLLARWTLISLSWQVSLHLLRDRASIVHKIDRVAPWIWIVMDTTWSRSDHFLVFVCSILIFNIFILIF